jgi:DNA-binding MarR family transcriptional regulator
METPADMDAGLRLAAPPDPQAADHRDELRLWLRLLTCATLIEGEVRARLRARFDVTLPRFDLMAQLEKAPRGLTLGDLSKRMMVSNGNITGLVERLVDSGHISRESHPTDRRIVFVRLTDAGHAAFTQMAREHAEWISSLFAGVPPAEQRTLLRLLSDLKQSVLALTARDGDA